jgi:hypothetical protein
MGRKKNDSNPLGINSGWLGDIFFGAKGKSKRGKDNFFKLKGPAGRAFPDRRGSAASINIGGMGRSRRDLDVSGFGSKPPSKVPQIGGGKATRARAIPSISGSGTVDRQTPSIGAAGQRASKGVPDLKGSPYSASKKVPSLGEPGGVDHGGAVPDLGTPDNPVISVGAGPAFSSIGSGGLAPINRWFQGRLRSIAASVGSLRQLDVPYNAWQKLRVDMLIGRIDDPWSSSLGRFIKGFRQDKPFEKRTESFKQYELERGRAAALRRYRRGIEKFLGM